MIHSINYERKYNAYDNGDYAKFVKKQIHLINEINDDKKVDYFAQHEKEHGWVDYVLSRSAKALKSNILNFNEGTDGRDRILSYAQIVPLSIAEPASWSEVMDQLELEERP